MAERKTWSHIGKIELCGLKRIGRIYLDCKNVIHFSLKNPPEGEGCVYAWVRLSLSGKPQQVLYIGQSSGTLKDRSNRHQSEWRKPDDNISGPSKRAREKTIAFLKAGHGVDIYGRVSERATVFKIDASLCSVEEKVAIKLINPVWNGSPQSIVKKQEANDEIFKDEE